jgi:ATP-binding cassette, subfamily B, bacterial PglK
MIKNFNKIYKFLPNKYKKKFLKLIFFSFILNIFEIFSLALIIPVVQGIFFNHSSSFGLIKIFESINFSLTSSQIFYTFVVIYMAKLLITYFINRYRESFTFKLNYKISSKLLKLYLNQPLSFFKQKNSSELLKNLNAETWGACGGAIRPYIVFLSEIMLVIVLIIFLLNLYFFYTIFFITFISTFSYLFFKIYKNKINDYSNTRVSAEEKTLRSYIESIGAIKEIKIFEKIEFFIQNFNKNKSKENDVRKKVEVLATLPRIFYEFMLVIILVVFFILSNFLDFNSSNISSMATAFFAVSLRLIPSFTKISQSIQSCSMYMISLKIIENELNNLNKIKPNTKNIEKLSFNNEIKLTNVNFGYDDKAIIQNFSCSIKKGDYIGISGRSGSGKSTLVNLIIGFETPESGIIQVDNKNINNNILGWYRNFGYVHQSNFFLNETIEKNITLNDEITSNYDKQRIEKILYNLNLEKFILNSANQSIGERGSKLSEGERQRLALARVLFKDISILILDEATSNLDKTNENLILKQIKKMNEDGLTLIHISHDESALVNANKYIKI